MNLSLIISKIVNKLSQNCHRNCHKTVIIFCYNLFMETTLDITEAKAQTNTEHRVFEEFLITYKPVLVKIEDYLEEVIEKTDPAYVEAYIPWKNALHELLMGAYLIARKIPLPNKEDFMEALCLFSFYSSIRFLRDICGICQLQLKRNWEKEFHDHIDKLLFAISTLNLQQQSAKIR